VEYDPLRRGFAEFVGTFALIFIGAGSILVFGKQFMPVLTQGEAAAQVYDGLSLLAIAVAHGLAIGVMASAVGHISGGHFNPAVTLGFLVTRRIAPTLAIVYWSMQFAAAALASALLRWIFTDEVRALVNLGAPGLGTNISQGQGLVIEIVLTFFLVWVIFATAADPGGTFRVIAGLAIGFTITMDILLGGPLTGAAMNPARAFGPELIQRDWDNFWVWYVGPCVGAVLAALAYEYLYLRPMRPLPVGPPETGVVEPSAGEAGVS